MILLHVRPTSILYGADWGAMDLTVKDDDEVSQQRLEDDFDALTSTKANDLAQPLVEANIPFKIHIVKDHDMKERLCLEVERLGLGAVIMGSRGFGASRKSAKGRLGSVSDYCVHHCVCPVIVVRYPNGKDGGDKSSPCPVAHDDEQEYHDATDKQTGQVYSVLLFISVSLLSNSLSTELLLRCCFLIETHRYLFCSINLFPQIMYGAVCKM